MSNLDDIAAYYAGKLATHGETAQGVDWNGTASQTLRFAQLLKVVDTVGRFSINDLGCGYGALLEHLRQMFPDSDYAGYDIAPEMVAAARQRHGEDAETRFVVAGTPDRTADFTVASGIFNVRLEHADASWLRFIEATLERIDEASTRGFAFNCLTSYSDADKMRDYLYYANPGDLFDLCKRRFSKDVALLHDYGLYEFTIIVRRL